MKSKGSGVFDLILGCGLLVECPDHPELTKPEGCITFCTVATFVQIFSRRKLTTQQRYKSFPIQDDEHFFVVCRYVERNALRAELVDRVEEWRWGSLW